MESRNTNTSVFRNLDWITVLLYLILLVGGALSIYAATYNFDEANIFDLSEYSGKQFLWIGISLIVGFSLLLIEKRLYDAYAYLTYVILIFLLILTIVIARDVKGSGSWISLGPISFQAAEFAKFATALALAKLFSGYNFVLNKSYKNYLKVSLIIILPIVLIILQRETGSALVYTALVFVLYREGMSGLILFFALCAIAFFVIAVKFAALPIMGISVGEFSVFIMIMILLVGMLFIYCKSFTLGRNTLLWFIFATAVVTILHFFGVEINGFVFFMGTIGGAIVYIIISIFNQNIKKILITVGFSIISIVFLFSVNYTFNNVLQEHQQKRIRVTLGLEDDPRGSGYNVIQSKIAIGSGGFSGKGFLNGTQTKLNYVPEHHTDFIFCTIGEEGGFVVSTSVLLLYLIFILRIIIIAERQHTAFGRVYAYCVASYLIFHICINIGMVIGITPVIGIPLPFFSYGGSSVLGSTILIFILLKIDASRKERINY